MSALATVFVVAMLTLVYGEHLFADAVARSWAHYVSDGAQAGAFWALSGLVLSAMVPARFRVAKSAMIGACVWGAAEGMLTAGCGWIEFGGRAHPEQWQGLCGRGSALPIAACGLTGFAVFLLSLFWRYEGARHET
jgi:hypothetical protein